MQAPAPEETAWSDAVGGAALVAMGLAIAAAGWQLLSRGRYSSGVRSVVQSALDAAGAGATDVVSEGSEDSFPASDAPSWTAGRGKAGLAGRQRGGQGGRRRYGRPSGRGPLC